jgi:fucose permease
MSAANRTTSSDQPRQALLIGLAYFGFVALGLSAGLLGVAWPSMRATFGVGLEAFGVLAIAATAGYIVASFSSGLLVARLGIGPLLIASGLVSALGLWGFAVAPAWWVAVLAAWVTGLGTAAIDSGLNTFVAVNADSRVMNWLHAAFGLGATLGPALMTLIITSGRPWRYGYAVGGLVAAALGAAIIVTLPRWRVGPPQTEPDLGASLRYVSAAGTLRLPALWLSILLAFAYTGAEVTVGQWSFSLLTEARSISPGVAGAWVSVFWGSFTVGRLVSGFAVARLGVGRLVRLSIAGLVLGSILMAWRADGALNLIGLVTIGLAQAPIFPLLMSTTPGRFGAAHAPNAIGFQISAAALGAAVLPGLVGLVAQSQGLEIIGPVVVVSSLVVSLLCEQVMGGMA